MKMLRSNLVGAYLILALLIGTCAAFGFYDPGVQRWVNRDPLGERGGVHLHQFVKNNAICLVDPDGEEPKGFSPRNPNLPHPGPKPPQSFPKNPMRKLQPRSALGCIAIMAGAYRQQLNQAQTDLDDCLETCNSRDYDINQQCIEACMSIFHYDATIAATKFAAASLGCMCANSRPVRNWTPNGPWAPK